MTLTVHEEISSDGCPMGNKCCMNTGGSNVDDTIASVSSNFSPYDPSQEPIFPPELIVRNIRLIHRVVIFSVL